VHSPLQRPAVARVSSPKPCARHPLAPAAQVHSPLQRPAVSRISSPKPCALHPPALPAQVYSPLQRLACVGIKFLEYSLAGMACGLVGQGIANSLIALKCAGIGGAAAPPRCRGRARGAWGCGAAEVQGSNLIFLSQAARRGGGEGGVAF
jgi:hypothetical protein